MDIYGLSCRGLGLAVPKALCRVGGHSSPGRLMLSLFPAAHGTSPAQCHPLPSGAAPWAVPWPQEQQRLCDTTETEFPAGHELPGSACARLAGTALYQGWSAQTLEL